MKKHTLLLIFSLGFMQINAQSKWFSVYNDSAALVTDAHKIVTDMTAQIKAARPLVPFGQNKAIKNTTPYLIYVDLEVGTVNLPFWEEVIPPQKQFFAEVSGGEKQGKDVFGLFFNGFYLAHELGHSFSYSAGKNFDNSYDSEYDANVIAILFWKQHEKSKLKKCYKYALKMLKTLKNPVPENENYKEYITKHYEELSSDPYKYGYIQFSQFVEIYRNKTLPDFDTYIKNYK